MTKRCDWCGKPIPDDNPLQRFCTDKSTCRVAAWRAKQADIAHEHVDNSEEIKHFKQR